MSMCWNDHVVVTCRGCLHTNLKKCVQLNVQIWLIGWLHFFSLFGGGGGIFI